MSGRIAATILPSRLENGERALELMCQRLNTRVAFGKKIAESRIRIDTARLLTLKTAALMDTVGNKHAQAEIAMIKVLAPAVAEQVLDWAIQAHGAAGVSDEVHRNAIAKLELAKYAG